MPFYFTTTELRATYPELSNTTRFPHDKLALARAAAEQWFEAAAKVAFLRRAATEVLTGNGKRVLFLSRWAEVGPVSSIKIDGEALSVGELAEVTCRKYGALERALGWRKHATIEVAYAHGYSTAVPELAKVAVMMLAAEQALPSTIPKRATSLSTDVGNYRISQADRTGKTGIPDVDAIIGLLGADKPVTG